MNKIIINIICLFVSVSGFCDSENTIGGQTGAGHIITNSATKVRQRPYLDMGYGLKATDINGKTVASIDSFELSVSPSGFVPYTGATGSVDFGNYGITANTGSFDILSINGNAVPSFVSPPVLATNPCINPSLAEDDSYLYVCIDTNTWKRVALNTWSIAPEQIIYESENVIFNGEEVFYP